MTRRELLEYAAALVPALAMAQAAESSTEINATLARIKSPVFPKGDFDITKYGAVGDGQTKCTDAIKKTIQACHAAGGGRILVPQGTFLTGAIHLESNMNLYVDEGATLLFSTDPNDYLPVIYTRFESTECMNYSPFIYAFEKENVGISGPGTLDGQADATHWWDWTRKARGGKTRDDKSTAQNDVQTLVEEMGNKDVPVKDRIFGPGHYLRPNFIQPYRCKNVLLEAFTIKRSPMWELNPTLCQNVTVRRVTVDCPNGPNNDGCDPDACTDVLIEKCTFSTGDDCIAIKSGRNRDGRRVGVPTSNVVIQDCVMKDGHGGVSIGSEVSGGMKNIWIRRCEMSSPHLQRALRIKTNSYRGGHIENISFTNVRVGQVADAVVQVTFYYEEGPGGPFKPTVKNIVVADVTCQKSQYGLDLEGYPDDPISGVDLSNCTFNNASKGNNFQNVEGVKVSNVTVNGKPITAAEMTAKG
ncbi:MAG TPA: glycoside hydrolase family 28 protein [Bryobacteraceae bacterium]|nr:glycoside hydrolase family 28 protein [Bryobacteraceae bacterium]